MNKIKSLLLLIFITMSLTAEASCRVDHYDFSVTISDLTFDQSYMGMNGEVNLKVGEDYVEVINRETSEVTRFDIGFFSNDGAGNFGISAISSAKATIIDITHDHETWHTGLEGYFTLPTGEIIDLELVTDCSYNKLFN